VDEEWCNSWTDPDGMYQMNARTRPEWGAVIETALRAAFDDHTDKGEVADDEAETEGDARPDDTPRCTRAEALHDLAAAYLDGHTTTEGLTPERYQAVVVIDHDQLAAADASDGACGGAGRAAATMQDIGSISTGVLGLILCEATLRVIVTKKGKPVTVTSLTRLATAGQRAAVTVRDHGHCQFPGCGRTRNLKLHHIVHHRDGGATHIDNLLLLCQHHHSLVHKPGWRSQRDPTTGVVTVTRPDGSHLAHANPRPPCDHPPRRPAAPRLRGTGQRLTNWTEVVMAGAATGER
jgi:hypothetical protein